MISAPLTADVITFVDARVRAWHSYANGWQIFVYVSPVVRRSGKLFAPIQKLLVGLGAILEMKVEITDEMMMFGKASLEVYRITANVDQKEIKVSPMEMAGRGITARLQEVLARVPEQGRCME
jgi:ABC-type protease/lipase transport system fused ATPase/permease subunit